jgi:hypothetical protein
MLINIIITHPEVLHDYGSVGKLLNVIDSDGRISLDQGNSR